ncbi:MAG: hypothetical protein EON54_23415 [Alcaligenaceae bacterium]|nr:MAG: hypothetical protein EON54_23415 [Alcaligenaceae bacterium]
MLDFDGVLHPSQGSDVPDFAALPLLEGALSGLECSVVISSTWREHYPLTELRALLGNVIRPHVVGVLGPDQYGQHVRYRNILVWLNANTWCTDWRALDDSASEFPPECPQLILCDGRIGMSALQVQVIKAWLRA